MRNAVRSFNILAVLIVVALFSTLLMAPGQAPAARAQGEAPTASPSGATGTYDIPKVVPYDFNGDVRDLPQMPATPPRMRPVLKGPSNLKQASGTEAPAQTPMSATAPAAPMPAPIQNFAGMNYSDACTGGQCGSGWPPDTNGDVGPNHYIQAVNDAYAIYNKTGTLLASFTENALWSGVGTTPCNGNANGDPIVLYDTISNRWILTHLAFAFSEPRKTSAIRRSRPGSTPWPNRPARPAALKATLWRFATPDGMATWRRSGRGLPSRPTAHALPLSMLPPPACSKPGNRCRAVPSAAGRRHKGWPRASASR